MERVKEATRDLCLDDLADLPRWVAWREDVVTRKDGEEKTTKVPYDPHRHGYKARCPTHPETWGTRAQAEKCADAILDRNDVGGVGIVLGAIDDDTLLLGIDLDSCFDKKGTASWAEEIIDRFDSYAEISPSGQGIKLFFLLAAEYAEAVEQLLRGKTRKAFVAGEHQEIAIDTVRFYVVTDDRFNSAPKTLRIVDRDDVRWFLEEAGPHYLEMHGVKAPRDESGSGYGMRFMYACKRQGMDYAAAVAAILADKGKAGEWAGRVDERQLQRAWEKTALVQESIHSWEDPDVSLLDDRRGDLPEFPVEVLRPRWLQEWVEDAAQGTATTVGHVAVPLLGISSALIGTIRRVEAARSWTEPMTCWIATIGFSGGGKTPGLDASRKPLAWLDDERQGENDALKAEHEEKVEAAKATQAHWKAEIKKALEQRKPRPPRPEDAAEPPPLVIPRLYVNDVTIERMCELLQARPGGMLWLADELSGWFANMSRYSGGEDNQFWLMAWDGRPYVKERRGSPPIKVDYLLVGVVGGLQPDKVAKAFKGAADGMYARFLFAWPDQPPYQPLSDKMEEVDPTIAAMLDKLARLPARKPPRHRVRLTTKARARFEEVRREVYAEIKFLDGREREWWAKIPAQVLRLAGTLAFIDWALANDSPPEPKEIRVEYLVAADDLVLKYFWPHAQAALRQIGLSERHADVRRVLKWIDDTGSEQVSREQIRRKALSKSRSADETQSIITALVKAGWLRLCRSKPSSGRPALRWEVNRRLWEKRVPRG